MKLFITSFIAFSLSVLYIFFSCEEEFEPEITKYENLLVVDALLTNLPGPHSVKLTYTYSYDESKADIITGAEVYIIDNNGTKETLNYTSDGNYCTSSSFVGVVGISYNLVITLNGKIYESGFQKLLPVNEIDSAYWARDEKLTDGITEIGIQLFADSKGDNSTNIRYSKWEFDETWEFEVESHLTLWDDQRVCWQTQKSDNYYVTSTEGQNGNDFKKEPLLFLDRYTTGLLIRYSANIFQKSISKEVYDFYKLLDEQQANGGSLFEKTPVHIEGNITCTSNSDEPVLGLFEVSAVTTKRLFIANEDIPSDLILYPKISQCERVAIGKYDLDEIQAVLSDGWVFGEIVVTPSGDTLNVYFFSQSCFDCTYNGFPNTPPKFWSYFDKN